MNVTRIGENCMATIERVKNKLEELMKGLPEGVEIVETYDRSSLINRDVDTLTEKLIEEFIVVALVCMLFMFHFRSSLVIVLLLPLDFLDVIIFLLIQCLSASFILHYDMSTAS